MPYVIKSMRKYFDWIVDNLNSEFTRFGFKGYLNYVLYRTALKQCKCYADYAAFIGELEAAKLEIYRTQIAPYEDTKIKQYGDVDE